MSAANPERLLATRRLYEGRIVNLRLDSVELAGGQRTEREIVEHGPAVAIVPLDSQGNVLLVRQYRQAASRALLEIPAGGIDAGEDAAAAAQRELQEETGFRAGVLEPMGGFYLAPGYCTEYIHLFLATSLSPSRLAADSDEDIAVERLPLSQASELVETGDICDAKSIAGLLLAQAWQSAGTFAD